MISIATQRKLVSNNAEEVYRLLARRLAFTKDEEVQKKVQNHPHYPSFASFDFGLKKFGIDTLAIQANYEQLKNDLPSPFIVHLSANNGMFLLAEKADDEYVHFINEKHQLEKETKEDFLAQWSGNVMALDADGITGTGSTTLSSALGKRIFIWGALVLCLALVVQQFSVLREWYNYAALFCTAFGLGVCTLLMIRFFDKHNAFIKQMCTPKKETSKKSCDAILESKAATVKGVSLSEIGFLTFSFLFLTLLLLPGAVSSSVVFIASCLAVPFSCYSVYYQYAKAKQWCPLCLYVQAALFVLFLIGIAFWDLTMMTAWFSPAIAKPVVLLTVIVALYMLVKPLLKKYYDRSQEQTQHAYNQLKFNPKVMQLLMDGEQIVAAPKFETIQLGNPEGEQVFTMVFSPTCGPCIDEQKKLLTMLPSKQNMRVEQIILVHPEDEEGMNIAMRMLNAHKQLDQEAFLEYFLSYFEAYPKSAKEWAKPGAFSDQDREAYGAILKEHRNWADVQGVEGTPDVFYGYKRLPQAYATEDLDYLCN